MSVDLVKLEQMESFDFYLTLRTFSSELKRSGPASVVT